MSGVLEGPWSPQPGSLRVWALLWGDFTAYHPRSLGFLWRRVGTAGCTVCGAWRTLVQRRRSDERLAQGFVMHEGFHGIH
jgi:hypothetical protein